MSISPDAPNPHFAVRPGWLALHDEPALEPGSRLSIAIIISGIGPKIGISFSIFCAI